MRRPSRTTASYAWSSSSSAREFAGPGQHEPHQVRPGHRGRPHARDVWFGDGTAEVEGMRGRTDACSSPCTRRSGAPAAPARCIIPVIITCGLGRCGGGASVA
jgi:hypothetical protein